MTVALLLAQTAATPFMTGVIWVVQVVHYPLFARVGVDGFREYEQSHQRRISLVVGIAMPVESTRNAHTRGIAVAPREPGPEVPAGSVDRS